MTLTQQPIRWFGALCLVGALFFMGAHAAGAAEEPPCASNQMTPVDLVHGHASPFADPCAPSSTPNVSFSESDRPSFSNYAVARIEYPDFDRLQDLTGRLDVWEVDRRDQTVVALVSAEDQDWLRQTGFAFSIDPTQTDQLPNPGTFQARTEAGIPGYACYRTVEETYADLATLASQNPTLAEWVDIGDSWDKITPDGPEGYDIFALVLTNKQRTGFEKGKLVVMAALHARELTTAEIATRFAERLLDGYGTDPDLTWLLDYNEIHIIPQANPDGRKMAEGGYLWRKNTDNPDACGFPNYGVDLNRNSSFLWNHCNGCSSSSTCSLVYRGPTPVSEPETQAIEAYLRSVFADQRGDGYFDPAPDTTNGVFLSLHAYGRLVIYPWDHSASPAPNMEALRTFGRKLGYYTGYGVCNTENCLYPVDGSTTDFAYGELGVASYTYEIGSTFFQTCSSFESSIAEKNLKSLVYAAKATRRPYQLAPGPDVTIAKAYPPRVAAGGTITLTATADDTRSASNGFGIEPTQPIAAVRFTVDAPSWLAAATGNLQPVDGSFNSAAEFLSGTLDTTGLQTGTHTIFLDAQDADGNWGPPTALSVAIGGAFALELQQEPAVAVAIPGQTVSYSLLITNTGDGPDVVVAQPQDGSAVVKSSRGGTVLAPTATLDLEISVSVPATATVGSAFVSLIEVSSLGDPGYRKMATLTTLVDVAAPGLSDVDVPPEMYLPLLSNQ